MESVRNLHAAPKVDRLGESNGGGVKFLLVRLQYGKTDIAYALHANPQTYSTGLVQTPDYLQNLGFAVSECGFFHGQCLVREVQEGLDTAAFAAAFDSGWAAYRDAGNHFAACGMVSRHESRPAYGDGHTATKSNRFKETSDEIFSYVLTWLDGGGQKGWTLHYRPKHPPMSPELEAALAFIGGFSHFNECPQFDFEPCSWRFIAKHQQDQSSIWDEQAGHVHLQFDAHAVKFSPGLQLLLVGNAATETFGMSLLKLQAAHAEQPPEPSPAIRGRPAPRKRSGYQYDVAISFAGPERPLAEELANLLRHAGVRVFYDRFFPEQLWGKDLPAVFDRIYRKDSRFCVIFVSREYAEREWTYHERRSAVARALAERGREYILPIQVEPVELDGIPPTIGYLSAKSYTIQKIAELLLKKLESAESHEPH